jgi:hypothetical protein
VLAGWLATPEKCHPLFRLLNLANHIMSLKLFLLLLLAAATLLLNPKPQKNEKIAKATTSSSSYWKKFKTLIL